jgi:hypothetical protein
VGKRNIILLLALVLLGALAAWHFLQPKPLLKNGALTQNFDGWETNAGISIFQDPVPHDWRFYWQVVKTGGVFRLRDINNDHFTALGAGDTVSSVLSQTVPLDGRGGRYELSLAFAATGNAGTTAVLQTSLTDAQGRVLAAKTLTNTQPVKTYYVPRSQERMEHLAFDIPAGTTWLKLSFADQSLNRGIAIDPLIKNVRLEKLH